MVDRYNRMYVDKKGKSSTFMNHVCSKHCEKVTRNGLCRFKLKTEGTNLQGVAGDKPTLSHTPLTHAAYM